MIFITFKYRYRKQIIIGILLFLIISIIIFFLVNYSLNRKANNSNDDKKIVEEVTKKENKKSKIEEYKVDIKGEVINPGIYTLKIDSRVIDVINMAGGLSDKADTSVINLSKKISDEMVIIIYSKQEVRNFEETKEKEKIIQNKCIKANDNALKNDACISSDNSTVETNNKVSINTGTQDELMTLPGIGESKAKDIIKYRETNGKFNSIEDIKKVSGIGDSLFAKIKENITT